MWIVLDLRLKGEDFPLCEWDYGDAGFYYMPELDHEILAEYNGFLTEC